MPQFLIDHRGGPIPARPVLIVQRTVLLPPGMGRRDAVRNLGEALLCPVVPVLVPGHAGGMAGRIILGVIGFEPHGRGNH